MTRNYVNCATSASSGLSKMITAIYKANEIVYNHRLFSTVNDLGAWASPEDLSSNELVLNLYFNHNANHQVV